MRLVEQRLVEQRLVEQRRAERRPEAQTRAGLRQPSQATARGQPNKPRRKMGQLCMRGESHESSLEGSKRDFEIGFCSDENAMPGPSDPPHRAKDDHAGNERLHRVAPPGPYRKDSQCRRQPTVLSNLGHCGSKLEAFRGQKYLA